MTEPKPKLGPAVFYFHFDYCDAKNSGACSCDPADYESLVLDLFDATPDHNERNGES